MSFIRFIFKCAAINRYITITGLFLSLFIYNHSFAQLSGTYTIGSGGTYASINEAITDLETQGISGPVVFEIFSGSYNEQLILNPIPGTSGLNTVTFRSQSGNAADVDIWFMPSGDTDNFVVQINGTGNLYFTDLSFTNNFTDNPYNRIVVLESESDNIHFSRNVFNGRSGITSTDRAALVMGYNFFTENITFSQNTFYYGSYAIYLYGSNTNNSTGTMISDNYFDSPGHVAIHLTHQLSPSIIDNEIVNSGSYGIYLNNCDEAVEIAGNRVQSDYLGGIYLHNCDGDPSYSAGHILIANNFVSTNIQNGRGMVLSYCTNLDVVYNSLYSYNGIARSTSFYVYYGSDINVLNNSFVNDAGGYAVEIIDMTAVNSMDHNNLYTHGNFIGLLENMEIRDLAEWQASSGHDANSVSAYGHYATETDLHTVAPWLDKKGISFSRITTDIDGEPRDGTTPDIGADEFTPDPATTIPMAGIYTVGNGGDYSTLNAAASDLSLRGVSDSVTIRLLSGNHNSQATFRPVPGVSESNSITIESESGNADNTTISYSATSTEDNFVIRLMGSRYLSLKNLTISATNSSGSDFGGALDLVGGIDFLNIEGCVLTGIPGNSGSTDRSLVRMNISYFNSFFIRDNQFLNGSYGIEMRGYAGNNHKTYGLIAENNQFTNNGYTGMYLYDVDGVKIRSNIFKGENVYYGLYLRGCNGSTEISKNRITGDLNYPLYLNYCSGSNPPSTYRILVSNNFISTSNGTGGGAFSLNYCSNIDVVYNSVYTHGNYPNKSTFYTNNGSNINIFNNSFVNNANGGLAAEIRTPSGISAMDFNNYYTTGIFIGQWGNASIHSMNEWKTVSGMDANSVSTSGHPISNEDLHTVDPWLDGKATPSTLVADDIDGEPRDATHPDIGADEFVPDPSTTMPLSGTYEVGPAGVYPDLDAAINDLFLKGVTDSVHLQLMSGTYEGQITIPPIPGTSETNTITIESVTGNPEDVILSYSATGANDNYVLRLQGSRYLRLKNITLSGNTETGTTYGRVVLAENGSDDIIIEGCILKGVPDAGVYSFKELFYMSGNYFLSMKFINNQFLNGSRGLYITGYNSTQYKAHNLVVENNQFVDNGAGGISVSHADHISMVKNIFHNNGSRAIYINSCNNSLEISKNQIINSDNVGIYLQECNGNSHPDSTHLLISNNFVSTSDIGHNGIFLTYCSGMDIVYNTVHMSRASNVDASAFRIEFPSAVTVLNNNFVNLAEGYAYYAHYPAGIDSSDHNNVYSNGAALGFWNGDRATLTDLQTASGKDLASISENPAFISADSYKFTNSALDSAGIPYTHIQDDIEGTPRDTLYTTVGAWKYDANILAIGNDEPIVNLPKEFVVDQNFPNPFNPVTNIRFGLPSTAHVKIEVYNVVGQRVKIALDATMDAGYHTVQLDISNLASGLYFYRVSTTNKVFVKKMMLLK
ncbi:MAG: hypothetical protein Kow00108_13490 [Calditrichia bacterium]